MPQPIDLGTELCHYVRLRYFPGMIENGAFTATRLDVWHRRDPVEGRYNAEDQARLDKESLEALEYLGVPKAEGEETIQLARKLDVSARFFCVYVVCFRKDHQERDECWQTYFDGQAGVMLRTTAGALLRAKNEAIAFEDVAYVDHEKESAIDLGKLSFFCKRKCFAWEREMRMTRYVVPIFDNDGNHVDVAPMMQQYEQRFGLKEGVKQYEKALEEQGYSHDLLRNPPHLPIGMRLKNLFSEIVLSPRMTDEEEAIVRRTVSAAGLNTIVRRS